MSAHIWRCSAPYVLPQDNPNILRLTTVMLGSSIGEQNTKGNTMPTHGTTLRIAHFENYLVRRFRLTSTQAECVIITLQRQLRERKPPTNVISIAPKNKYFQVVNGGRSRRG